MTKDFKTLSAIVEREMPKILGNNQYAGKTILGIDGGYSAVKIVSANKTAIYPSYAKILKEDLQIVGQLKDNDILLRDNITGNLWAIGSTAENMLDRKDLEETTDESLFTRYRYNSDLYKAIMSAGIAIGLLDTVSGNDIYITTGLPSSYLHEDGPELVRALAGDYDLSIKVGNADFRHLVFNIKPEHVTVIEQPQGTLTSCAFDKTGKLLPDGQNILTSNSIIWDMGFGTEDIFAIRGGVHLKPKTYSDTNMRAVFEETIKELSTINPAANYKIFEFQKFLEEGKATYFNRSKFASEYIEFEEILRRKNRELCNKSIERLMETYDNLMDFKYLIVTGGTGESRFEQIKERLGGLSHLKILRCNQNDTSLPFSFSNANGYYLYQYFLIKKELASMKAGA